jgi:hypothetical protein
MNFVCRPSRSVGETYAVSVLRFQSASVARDCRRLRFPVSLREEDLPLWLSVRFIGQLSLGLGDWPGISLRGPFAYLANLPTVLCRYFFLPDAGILARRMPFASS